MIRLDLDADGWSVTAVECALSRTNSKDEEGREKLEFMRARLADRFTDLSAYGTLFATITAGKLHYSDAGRSWTRV